MAENQGQEKTEDATPKRLREAREKGQIPRSRELSTMSMMMAAALGFIVFGDTMIEGIMTMMDSSFTPEREHIFDAVALPNIFMNTVTEALLIITPFLILMVIVAILSSLLMSGWNFSTKAIAFKWEKLDPIKGLGRVFAVRGLVELIKALLKFFIIGVTAVFAFMGEMESYLGLGGKAIDVAIADMGSLLTLTFLIISMSLIILALLDVPFQLWDNARQLKMSKQEIRDEMKQTEGNPEVRSRIRQIQREMAQQRMMEEVPQADVVVTNPTHYAVALRYDQQGMRAPVLIAKGIDLIAGNIRGVAAEHHVPVIASPALARALYYSTELEQEIPLGLFQAVAQVLAYVFHLKEGNHAIDEAIELENLPIPDDLRRD